MVIDNNSRQDISTVLIRDFLSSPTTHSLGVLHAPRADILFALPSFQGSFAVADIISVEINIASKIYSAKKYILHRQYFYIYMQYFIFIFCSQFSVLRL